MPPCPHCGFHLPSPSFCNACGEAITGDELPWTTPGGSEAPPSLEKKISGRAVRAQTEQRLDIAGSKPCSTCSKPLALITKEGEQLLWCRSCTLPHSLDGAPKKSSVRVVRQTRGERAAEALGHAPASPRMARTVTQTKGRCSFPGCVVMVTSPEVSCERHSGGQDLTRTTLAMVQKGGSMASWLMKKGGRSIHRWQKRYTVLNGDFLFYFPSNKPDAVPNGAHCLVGMDLISRADRDDRHKNMFRIQPRDPELKALDFMCDTEKTKALWLRALDRFSHPEKDIRFEAIDHPEPADDVHNEDDDEKEVDLHSALSLFKMSALTVEQLAHYDAMVRAQALVRRMAARRLRRKLEAKRARLRLTLRELLTTEIAYVDGVECASAVFKVKMEKLGKSKVVDQGSVDKIFCDIDAISELHRSLLPRFEALLDPKAGSLLQVGVVAGVSELVLDLVGLAWPLYPPYVNNFDDAQAELTRLGETNKNFGPWLQEVCAANQERLRGRDLRSFLIMPVQRIMRYSMLLMDAIKSIDEFYSPGWKAGLQLAHDQCIELAQQVNEAKRVAESRERLAELTRELVGFQEPLLVEQRLWVHEGEVQVLEPNSPRAREQQQSLYLFLFSDILIATRPRQQFGGLSDKKFQFHQSIKLSEAAVKDLPAKLAGKNTLEVAGEGGRITFVLASAGEKTVWLDHLRRTIAKAEAAPTCSRVVMLGMQAKQKATTIV